MRCICRGELASLLLPWLPFCLGFGILHASALGRQFNWLVSLLFPKKILVGLVRLLSALDPRRET